MNVSACAREAYGFAEEMESSREDDYLEEDEEEEESELGEDDYDEEEGEGEVDCHEEVDDDTTAMMKEHSESSGGGGQDAPQSASKARKKAQLPIKRIQPQISEHVPTHRLFAASPKIPAPRPRSRPPRRPTYVPVRVPIPRGSIEHIILKNMGKLDESLLVDGPEPGATSTGNIPESTAAEDSDKFPTDKADADDSVDSSNMELEEQQRKKRPTSPPAEQPETPKRICFRSTVMPMHSASIPAEKYRIIVMGGKHRMKTGMRPWLQVVVLLTFVI